MRSPAPRVVQVTVADEADLARLAGGRAAPPGC